MTPKGIMVHSTGANNPKLSRFVGPDDGLLGVNKYNNHWNQHRPNGHQVCVHAFIGKLQDGSIATYETLPHNVVGWHSGGGKKGSANKLGYIGFEICEGDLNDKIYFDLVYKESAEYCAYLCTLYSWNPLADGVILCHSEGNKRGIASNHGDVMHWFPKHDKSMDSFRQYVHDIMKDSGDNLIPNDNIVVEPSSPVSLTKKSYIKIICPELNIRKSASWKSSAVCGIVRKNEVFTVIGKETPVGSKTPLYRLKSGVYITTSSKYVKYYEK